MASEINYQYDGDQSWLQKHLVDVKLTKRQFLELNPYNLQIQNLT